MEEQRTSVDRACGHTSEAKSQEPWNEPTAPDGPQGDLRRYTVAAAREPVSEQHM